MTRRVFVTALAPLVLAAQKVHSDDEIYDMVRQRLANDVDIKGGALEVDVKDGVVTVRGEVGSERARAKTEKVVKKVKGVKAVKNETRVKTA
ncbi:MAG: BON domain-containing protein [Bryobacteraceae bacterium]|nr:BON domain-containing protein [Bryobacteraceae bacterium]